MIINMSDDTAQTSTRLGQQYNENIISYRDMVEQNKPFQHQTRLTFNGHGNENIFGDNELEPEDFADQLIASGIEQATKVKIDLLGCGSGYCGPHMKDTSYAHRVFNRLKDKGYDNVTVNAFVNLDISENTIAGTIFSEELGTIKATKFYSWGENKPDAQIINREDKEVIEQGELVLTRTRLKNQIKKTTDNQLKEQLTHKLNEVRSKLTRLAKSTDFRRALDTNPKFQINDETWKDLGLSLPQQRAMIMLNDRIAELTNELIDIQNSGFQNISYWIQRGDIKEKKLQQLTDLKKSIRSAKNTDALIDLVHNAIQDEALFTSRTRAALENIREDLWNISKLQQPDYQIIFSRSSNNIPMLIFEFTHDQGNEKVNAVRAILTDLRAKILDTNKVVFGYDHIHTSNTKAYTKQIETRNSIDDYVVLSFKDKVTRDQFTEVLNMHTNEDHSIIIPNDDTSIYIRKKSAPKVHQKAEANIPKKKAGIDYREKIARLDELSPTVSSQFNLVLNLANNDEKAEIIKKRGNVQQLFDDINEKVKKHAQDGGLNENNEWTNDPDNRHRHKFEVLAESAILLSGSNETSMEYLSQVIDRSPAYKKTIWKISETEKLLEKVKNSLGKQTVPITIDVEKKEENLTFNTRSEIITGASGAIYIDGVLSHKASAKYIGQPEKARECSKQCKAIQKQVREIMEAGGYENGIWENDPDQRFQHKFRVLRGTMAYLLGKIDNNELNLIVDRSPNYIRQTGGFESREQKMINEATRLNNQNVQDILNIDFADFPPAELKPSSLVEAGKSGYIYIDGVPSQFAFDKYLKAQPNKDKAWQCINYYKSIQNEMAHCSEEGNLINDSWHNDPDDRYRHRYEVLDASRLYLLGEIELGELRVVVDRCKYYGLNDKAVVKLVNNIVELRNEGPLDPVARDYLRNNHQKISNPFKLERLILASTPDPEKLNFHHHILEAGTSGIIYIDGKISDKVSDLYLTPETANTCANLFHDIQKRMSHVKGKGGFKDNKWTNDPDNRFRHKYEMLSMTLGYLAGEASFEQLSITSDRCSGYDENPFGKLARSTTGKLLDQALLVRNENRKLNEINDAIIQNAQPAAMKNINSFFGSEKVIKKKIENMNLEVGSSGLIYINKEPDSDLRKIYQTPANSRECVAICRDIESRLKELKKEGNFKYGKWKDDPYNHHRHQYNVLAATMKYLLNETSLNNLEKTIELSSQYDRKGTKKLLDRALDLRKESLKLGVKNQYI